MMNLEEANSSNVNKNNAAIAIEGNVTITNDQRYFK